MSSEQTSTAAAVAPAETTDAYATGSYIWVVLGLAVTAQTAGSIVSQGIYTLVPFWKSAFGISQASAALAVTALNLGQILSMIGLGRAIDRHGERSVVGVTMIATGLICFIVAGFVDSYPMMLLMLLILGAFYASVQPGGTRAILRWFPPRHRGLATGFRQAAVPLGTSIAALLLPFLAVRFDWRAAVHMQGAIGVVGGVFFWLFYRDDLGQGTTQRPVPVTLTLVQLLRTLGRDKTFRPVLVAGVAMSAFQFTLTAHAISYLADHFRLDLVAAASLLAGMQIVGIPARVLLPWISDRFWPGRRVRSLGWLMLAGSTVAAGLVLLPAGIPDWLLLTTVGGLGVFAIGWFPLYILQIAEMAPKSAIASTVSLATTLCMIAMSLVPLLFGLVVDLQGYASAWALLIVPVVLAAVPLCLRTSGA